MIKLKALCIYFLFIVNIISQNFSITAINSYLDEIPSSTNFGIMIYDPLSVDTLFAKNSDASLIPASNIKLFTTATAIDLLGKDYRLKTVVGSTDTNFTDGSIDGDLILKGFGNSMFTEEDLDSLVNVLVNLGIKQINGNVFGDDTFFDNIYSRDDWIVDEKANVSLPPVSALILDRNGFIVSVDANKSPGAKVGFSLKPDINFYEVDNSAKVVKFRRTPRVSSRFTNNKISVRVSGGAKQRKFPYSYVLYADNPTLYAAYTLFDKLIKNGITISGTAGTLTEETNFFDIAESSTSLSEIIPLINKNSDNFLAECLFKTLGAYYSGKIGNSFYATQAVMNFLEENEIPEFYELSIVDGSGISRFNEVTAASITNLLEKIYLDVEKYEFFKNSLSIAGKDGTLDRRFRRSKLRGNFYGKTGTLNGVTSLSGYLETKSGKDLIVSFLMQFKDKGAGYHKDIQDKILEYLWENY
jgi:PBP4 family serine-type D-alanyl-D-alanine carboxypeptidase